MNAEPLLTSGDAMRALAALVEEQAPFLYRYAYRLCGCQADAEDLLQQTFLMAHRHYEQLRQPEKARGWLCTILRNAFLKQCRHRATLSVADLESLPELSVEARQDPIADSEELQQALDELPDEYRLPIVMFYFEELSYKEIAEQLQVPMGTVMSRLARAKAHLRKRLDPCSVP